MRINGRTALTGLLGSPVSHSISPLMHNLAFELCGIPAVYLCFDVPEDSLEAAVKGLVSLSARGWNCTWPDKNRMAGLCDWLSPAAGMIGAVNTVVNEDGVLKGYNTDGIGYQRAAAAAGYHTKGKKLVLFGNGGAATSILVQEALDGAREISVFCRRESRFYARSEELAARLNQETECCVRLFPYEPQIIRRELESSDFLIHATSVGMAPDEEACMLPEEIVLPPELIVSDIIYHPKKTRLLKRAEACGCRTFNGMYMLLYQGAAAFQLWTGQEMPVEAVKERYFAE